jgi:hypothetical protein
MKVKEMQFAAVAIAVLISSVSSPAQRASGPGIAYPADTTISTIKDTAGQVVTLNAEEKVAFLFVNAIEGAEGDCLNTFFGGPGRLCTMEDLVKGVRTKSGVIGLSTDPARDPNYSYKLSIIVGQTLLITALPRHPGIGAFALVGTGGEMGHIYFNPNGGALTTVETLTDFGIGGNGFKRSAM